MGEAAATSVDLSSLLFLAIAAVAANAAVVAAGAAVAPLVALESAAAVLFFLLFHFVKTLKVQPAGYNSGLFMCSLSLAGTITFHDLVRT